MCGLRLETQGLHYQDNLVQDFAEFRISSFTAKAHSDIRRGEQAGRIPQEKLVKQLGASTVRFYVTNERIGQKRQREKLDLQKDFVKVTSRIPAIHLDIQD